MKFMMSLKNIEDLDYIERKEMIRFFFFINKYINLDIFILDKVFLLNINKKKLNKNILNFWINTIMKMNKMKKMMILRMKKIHNNSIILIQQINSSKTIIMYTNLLLVFKPHSLLITFKYLIKINSLNKIKILWNHIIMIILMIYMSVSNNIVIIMWITIIINLITAWIFNKMRKILILNMILSSDLLKIFSI